MASSVDACYFLSRAIRSCYLCPTRIPLYSHIKTCTNEIAPTNHNRIIFYIQIRGRAKRARSHAQYIYVHIYITKAKSQVLVCTGAGTAHAHEKWTFTPASHSIFVSPYTNYDQCLIKANVFNSVPPYGIIRICTHTHISLTYSNYVLVSLSIALLLYFSCKLNVLILPFSISLRLSSCCMYVSKHGSVRGANKNIIYHTRALA